MCKRNFYRVLNEDFKSVLFSSLKKITGFDVKVQLVYVSHYFKCLSRQQFVEFGTIIIYKARQQSDNHRLAINFNENREIIVLY